MTKQIIQCARGSADHELECVTRVNYIAAVPERDIEAVKEILDNCVQKSTNQLQLELRKQIDQYFDEKREAQENTRCRKILGDEHLRYIEELCDVQALGRFMDAPTLAAIQKSAQEYLDHLEYLAVLKVGIRAIVTDNKMLPTTNPPRWFCIRYRFKHVG